MCLRGQPPNTHGIGARFALSAGPLPRQGTEVMCGGRYRSGADTLVTLAAGTGSNPTPEVNWRSRRRTVVTGVSPDRLYEIVESHLFLPELLVGHEPA